MVVFRMIAGKLTHLDEPGQEEVLTLRCFDPDRFFLGKLKGEGTQAT